MDRNASSVAPKLRLPTKIFFIFFFLKFGEQRIGAGSDEGVRPDETKQPKSANRQTTSLWSHGMAHDAISNILGRLRSTSAGRNGLGAQTVSRLGEPDDCSVVPTLPCGDGGD